LVLLVVLFSSVGYACRHELHHLRQWGYLGLAIMSFLGGATVVLLPVPSLAFTFAMGAALDPWAVGFVASSAETLGTLTGYLVGARALWALGENAETTTYAGRLSPPPRARDWTRRYGLWAVFVFSAIPNPFLDLVGIGAGALHIAPWKFVTTCWLGKTVKTLAVAWAGAGMLPAVAKLLFR
jgi:membrane protein YqaA with SNARE-associated domain